MKYCKVLEPELFEDHRGTIRSFYPDQEIVEWNLMITKEGDARGYHYHPHFTEYITVVDGVCLFKEYDGDEVNEQVLQTGDSICIPKFTAHTFIALTDFKFVSLLTKRWHDSDPPIVKVDENGKPV